MFIFKFYISHSKHYVSDLRLNGKEKVLGVFKKTSFMKSHLQINNP